MLPNYGPQAGYLAVDYELDLLVLFRSLMSLSLICHVQEGEIFRYAESAHEWINEHRFLERNTWVCRALETALHAAMNEDADDASFLFEISDKYLQNEEDQEERVISLTQLEPAITAPWDGSLSIEEWQEAHSPEGKRIFREYFKKSNLPMSFWIDWYESLVRGEKPDWELWREIALIDDKIWKSGPEAVAREIERIKEKLSDKRAEQFKDHIKTLQPRFSVIAPQADKLADLIEAALNEFQREVSNKIPDSIEPLTKLPPILRKIALEMAKVGGQGQIDAIADLVAAMSETITVLNSRLESANRLHPDDRSLDQSRLGRFFDSNGMSGWLLAGVTTFFSLVSGPAGDATAQQTIELTVNQVCITDLEAVEPPRPEAPAEKDEPSDLPETKDI